MLLAGRGLYQLVFIVGPPPEPKVESSTLSSRTSLRSPLRCELRLGKPALGEAESEGCRAEVPPRGTEAGQNG